MTYEFLGFQIDLACFAISACGKPLDPEPKVLELVVFLIERRERLVTRDELMQGLWPERIVSEGTLTNTIKSARQLLNDDGKQQSCIKTVHGKGYRFVSDVTENYQVDAEQVDFPYVAVLPFQNMGPSQEDGFFAEGISEDIITELSRFSDVRVVARHSSFQYNSAGADVTKIKEELGVDYLLEGSVRRRDGRVRITAQLIELDSSAHIWAERYDCIAEDLYAVEDEIVGIIASIVCGEVREVEMMRSQVRKTKNLTSYDHLLRGLRHHKSPHPDVDGFKIARKEFEKALELDPDNPRARAWILCAEASAWTAIDPQKIREFIDKAQQVLELDNDESEAHRILGSLYFTNKDYDKAELHFGHALRLNPNDAQSAIKYSHFLACTGRAEDALQLAQLAKRLNPRHQPWYDRIFGFVNYSLGQYDVSCESYRKVWGPDILNMALLAACYVAMGDTAKARQCASELREAAPEITADALLEYDCYRDPKKLISLKHQMQLAGIH